MALYFRSIHRNADAAGPEGGVAKFLFEAATTDPSKTFTEDELRRRLKLPDRETEILNKLAEYGFTAEVVRE